MDSEELTKAMYELDAASTFWKTTPSTSNLIKLRNALKVLDAIIQKEFDDNVT